MTPKILVVGDAMTDVYHIGEVSRLSAEAPIPVVEVNEVLYSPGGAANVWENLEALQVEHYCISGVGDIRKNRLMVGNTQVARWDTDDQLDPIDGVLLKEWVDSRKWDGIIVADYGKGSIGFEAFTILVGCKIPLFVDTKINPQPWAGEVTDLTLFPNDKEYYQWYYDKIEKHQPTVKVVHKMGAEGIRQGATVIKSKAKKVVSVCGAGDTVVAAYTYAILTNHPNPLAFANIAAGIVVEKPFTAFATLEEINEVFNGTND